MNIQVSQNGVKDNVEPKYIIFILTLLLTLDLKKKNHI